MSQDYLCGGEKMSRNGLRSTSKYISLILRHKPEAIGISLDEHGWADVQELISGINRSGKHSLSMEFLDIPVADQSRYLTKL